MTISNIKNQISSQPDYAALTRLIAQNWQTAWRELKELPEDILLFPNESLLLMTVCRVIADKGDYPAHNSGERERVTEKLKAVFAPIDSALSGSGMTVIPVSYTSVEYHMQALDSKKDAAETQLVTLFKALPETASDALLTALYGVVSAYYGDVKDATIAKSMKLSVDDPYEIGCFARMTHEEQADALNEAAQTVYATPQANAQAAYTATASHARPHKTPGKWLPLKICLIASTLFIALVVGLVFYSMSTGFGGSAMSIMNTSGEMVSIEPGIAPVELFIFGTVDYDGLIAGIKTAAIIFVVWRVLLITAVYIFNYRCRRKAAYHP